MRRTAVLSLAVALAASLAAAPAPDAEAPHLRAFFADWRPATEQVHVNVFADDRQRGGSTITEIAITVDGEPFDVVPLDGAYDQPFEEVDVDLSPATIRDSHEVCATATDAAGNTAEVRCEVVATGDRAAPFTSYRPFTSPARPDLADEVVLHAAFQDHESTIASGSYSIDGGPMRPMVATDGAFDERRETLRAEVGVLAAGTHRLCVYAVDEHGNSSSDALTAPVGDAVPRECVDVEVRDRRAPVVTSIEQTPSPAAFGEEVVVAVTVDDRGRGDADIRHARVTVDGEELSPLYGTSETGPLVTILVPLDGFATTGPREICVRASDEAVNFSDWTCGTIEITDRIAVGALATRSQARPEPSIGPGGTFTVDALQTQDGTVRGGFTYEEPGIAFAADLPSDTVFEGRGLDHRLHAAGTGLLHGVVACDYELTVLDHAGQDDETDSLSLTVTCDGTVVVDGAERATSGDVDIRA